MRSRPGPAAPGRLPGGAGLCTGDRASLFHHDLFRCRPPIGALADEEALPRPLWPGSKEVLKGRSTPSATVVFVMNHRSNMDYVLLTWLVSGQASISYAVGEWARIWPFSRFIRATGAYFIRRGKPQCALYRKVLARYVQMATEEGNTQAIFPEGGLSLDGRLAKAAAGASDLPDADRDRRSDVVFIPVGLAYDRVLEDQILTEAAASGNAALSRRAPASPALRADRAATPLVPGRLEPRHRCRRLWPPGLAGGSSWPGARPLGRGPRREVDGGNRPGHPRPARAVGGRLPACSLTVPALVAACAARLKGAVASPGSAISSLAPQGMEATVSEALAILRSRGLGPRPHASAGKSRGPRLLRRIAATGSTKLSSCVDQKL